jgi:hypothetical protein
VLQSGGSTVSRSHDITDDRLVADYLNKLAAAAAGLPADRRAELFEEISLHIAEARAVQATAGVAIRPAVADVLERLGPPEDIVRAAADDTETDATAAAPAPPAPRRRFLAIGTVILLLLGGLLIGLGWIAGVVMLWTSARWRTSDKLLGTLVWPGGLAAILTIPRFGAGLPPLLALLLLLVGVAAPIVVATRLLRRAWRAPAGPPAGPQTFQAA